MVEHAHGTTNCTGLLEQNNPHHSLLTWLRWRLQGPRQPGFNSFFMPATGELVKAVFGEEPSGTITQGLAEKGGFKAFGEQRCCCCCCCCCGWSYCVC
jgi:hypothetical protein